MSTRTLFSSFLCAVFLLSLPSLSRPGPLDQTTLTDTVYVDDFERADGPLGADWNEDGILVISSGEVDDTDASNVVDDLAVYVPHTDPIGVSLVWGNSATPEGIDKAGLAFMLSGPDTLANGYMIFKNLGTNQYALRLVVNGAQSTRIANGTSDRLYPSAGDTFQVRLRSDAQGHHFDVFYNHELDATLTDPDKTYGNEPVLYSGLLMGGGANNNVEEFRFVKFDDDVTPPSAITDLTATVRSDTSIALRWTATGDDGNSGRAKSYEVRHHSETITEANWDDAVRVVGEPFPQVSGATDSMVVYDLTPDTQYYLAMKVSDGFPTANFSGLSNVVTARTIDTIAPTTIEDLHVVQVEGLHVTLGWTAPGDSDTLGTATQYDVRYSLNPITHGNFAAATQARGEPVPLPYGTYQEFTLPELAPGTHYYFAMKTADDSGNWSSMSNVVDATTQSGTMTRALDDFERAALGPWWTADPELELAGGELVNLSGEDRWDFVAIFNPSPNLEEASYVWSESVDPEGTRNAGLVLMMDAPDPDADGYLIFRHDVLDRIALWSVVGGVPTAQLQTSNATLPDPMGGDEIRIVIIQDESGNHFDFYVNGTFDNRVSDPSKLHGTQGDWYCGLMMHGDRNNNIEGFAAAGPTTQIPPSPFFLLEPFDGDTVEVANPRLDWMDALELNPGDIVYYSLFASLSQVYDPESTFVVDSLTVSEYTLPPASILDLYRKSANAALSRSLMASDVPLTFARRFPRPVSGASLLPDDVEIFWKVSAYDNTGQDTTWSINTDWSFFVSIPDAPNPFSLHAPADGDTVKTQNLVVTFVWHAATDPDPLDTLLTYNLIYQRTGDTAVTVPDLADTTFTTAPLIDESTYTWHVTAVDGKGLTRDSDTWIFYTRIPTGIEEQEPESPVLPKVFALSQNYPNPFNPRTMITFDVPEKEKDGVKVDLEIFSLRGLKVRTLLREELLMPGTHTITWDGRDEQASPVGSGIYIYRITAGEFTSSRKMLLTK